MKPELPVTAAQRLQQIWLARGPLAWLLLPLSAVFAAVAASRRMMYRLGWLRRHRAAVPVIVVGNLIAGGAGKTPTVIALIDMLRRHGYKPGVVSRGFGRHSSSALEVTRDTSVAQSGDEPLLMHLRTRAPVLVGRDRAAASRQLLLRHPDVDVIVSDDGLQHFSLARDVQILVFDERGAGNGWLLPAGPLREPLPSAVPARTLVLYNTTMASTSLPGSLVRRSLVGVVTLSDWWHGKAASMGALDSLRGRPLVAAAGLAQPTRFFQMLRDHGLTIATLPLPDHHEFATLPWPGTTADVVLTEKDAIKLNEDRVGTTRVWVAPLDFAFDTAFEAALIDLLPPPGTHHGNTPA